MAIAGVAAKSIAVVVSTTSTSFSVLTGKKHQFDHEVVCSIESTSHGLWILLSGIPWRGGCWLKNKREMRRGAWRHESFSSIRVSESKIEDDVVVSVESIRTITERFVNTTYGFFLGKRVTYAVVANYVRNTWGKYGPVRSMFSSSTGLFSFQFSSMDRLDAMLKNGPWFIRNNPLIMRKWHPNENLLKEYISTIPV
ncbi:hypothetical protein Tco_1377098 [Tanacetum coccineum]